MGIGGITTGPDLSTENLAKLEKLRELANSNNSGIPANGRIEGPMEGKYLFNALLTLRKNGLIPGLNVQEITRRGLNPVEAKIVLAAIDIMLSRNTLTPKARAELEWLRNEIRTGLTKREVGGKIQKDSPSKTHNRPASHVVPVDAGAARGIEKEVFVRSARFRVASDCNGKITHVILQYGDPRVLATYEGLFKQMDPNTRFTIVVGSQADADFIQEKLREWGIPNPERFDFVVLDDGASFTIWTRDNFLPLSYQGDAVLVEPYNGAYQKRSWGLQDQFVAERVDAASPRISQYQSDLNFQGGNVVANDRFVFIGYNMVSENLGTGGFWGSFRTEKEFLSALERFFGKKVIVIGGPGNRPPHFHADMYITPIGGNTIMVGDPRLAGQNGPLADNLDGVARSLESQGFTVVRVPLQVVDGDNTNGAIESGSQARLISYNNVIIEEVGGERIVYMPVYGIPELDAQARAIWEGQGYTVKEIDVSAIYLLGGTVRCICQVERTEDSPAVARMDLFAQKLYSFLNGSGK